MPLALHIPHVVEQVGSLAGFAAVIGLAVLSALYFSQARDLRRLREWAGRAPERAAGMGTPAPTPLPGRVTAQPQQPRPAQPQGQAQPQPQPQQAAPAAATNGDAAPSVTAAPGAAKPADAEEAKADEAKAEEGKEEQAKEAEAKPGMPAPASAAAAGAATAAAAAGAGAASVAGPKAPPAPAPNAPSAPGPNAPSAPTPGAATPPKAAPQRPPGSVLPPRTGTMPPVRRLPSSNVGGGQQTSVLGPQPTPQKKRNPVYIVLAVAGVLVLGAAAAIGVPALVNGSKDKNGPTSTAKKASKTSTKKTASAVTPSQITVAVLNGTSIPGLAAQIGDRVEADGFRKGTISNASLTNGQRANSVVMYAGGHSRDARLVAKKLDISGSVQPVDSATQQIAGDASVVVIVGTDKTQ